MSDMYDWVNAQNINPLAGKCSHECAYCYVERMKTRMPEMRRKYSGSIRLDERVISRNIKKEGIRFLCSCNDLFAENVPSSYILDILDWAKKQTTSTWAIQTKNPRNEVFQFYIVHKPPNFLLGVTIETNRNTPMSKAPSPVERFTKGLDYITIEPIMDFDLSVFLINLVEANPTFINIGADSNANKTLPEPSKEKTIALIEGLKDAGIEVRIKSNLERIIGGGGDDVTSVRGD